MRRPARARPRLPLRRRASGPQAGCGLRPPSAGADLQQRARRRCQPTPSVSRIYQTSLMPSSNNSPCAHAATSAIFAAVVRAPRSTTSATHALERRNQRHAPPPRAPARVLAAAAQRSHGGKSRVLLPSTELSSGPIVPALPSPRAGIAQPSPLEPGCALRKANVSPFGASSQSSLGCWHQFSTEKIEREFAKSGRRHFGTALPPNLHKAPPAMPCQLHDACHS